MNFNFDAYYKLFPGEPVKPSPKVETPIETFVDTKSKADKPVVEEPKVVESDVPKGEDTNIDGEEE